MKSITEDKMMTETQLNPFENSQPPANVNGGAVAVETERAVQEARGQIQLAKMFPRSITAASEELMEACKNAEFAESAFYAVPNRGSGPSIRFAEEIARCYGNFEYGHRELSRTDGKSEVEVYAWDKEKNNYSKRQITVHHVLDTKQGPRKLTNQADIDNRIANIAAKQMRGRILALVSKSLVATGIAECQRTLSGGSQKTIQQRVNDMISAFSQFGVRTAMLADYVGHSLDNATADDMTDLVGVYNALKEGARVADYFDLSEDKPKAPPEETGKSGLGEAAKKAAGGSKGKKTEPAKDKPKAADKPAEKAEPKPDAKSDQEPPTDTAPAPEPSQDGDDDLF